MALRFLLYGATGFSGRLVADLARRRGLAPVLAGRDAVRLARLGQELGFEHRVLPLEEPERLAAGLRDVEVVLNAAGPFSSTARPLVDACLGGATHYLDVAGELPVLEAIARRGGEAAANGTMLMPAVGFVVVPSDCLAAHVARRLPGARRLVIGVSRATSLSRGSLRSILEQWSDKVTIRRAGSLATVPIGERERRFDFGRGPSRSVAVSWPDVVTAHHTTGIPDIEVYLEASPSERAMFRWSSRLGSLLEAAPVRQLLQVPVDLLADGPGTSQRAAAGRVIVAEAHDGAGRKVSARLGTPEAYGFTAAAALAVVERVSNGDFKAGFQTPAGLYGPDFVLALDGVGREDLPS